MSCDARSIRIKSRGADLADRQRASNRFALRPRTRRDLISCSQFVPVMLGRAGTELGKPRCRVMPATKDPKQAAARKLIWDRLRLFVSAALKQFPPASELWKKVEARSTNRDGR